MGHLKKYEYATETSALWKWFTEHCYVELTPKISQNPKGQYYLKSTLSQIAQKTPPLGVLQDWANNLVQVLISKMYLQMFRFFICFRQGAEHLITQFCNNTVYAHFPPLVYLE